MLPHWLAGNPRSGPALVELSETPVAPAAFRHIPLGAVRSSTWWRASGWQAQRSALGCLRSPCAAEPEVLGNQAAHSQLLAQGVCPVVGDRAGQREGGWQCHFWLAQGSFRLSIGAGASPPLPSHSYTCLRSSAKDFEHLLCTRCYASS